MPDLPEEESVSPEIESKRKKLEQLVQTNAAMESELIKRYQVTVQPWVIVNMRIDMLLNAILEDEDRYEFEIEFAKNLQAVLRQIQAEKSKGGLTIPKQSPLLLPGA